jgi:N-[(2S)-2-amino-2-carboxyethyl]-L-glutamate dehydrogenase
MEKTYLAHSNKLSSLPFSIFLKFFDNPKNRIIGLPAYIKKNNTGIAGIKWISSFPENINHKLNRASAITILNSTKTGYPCAILEGSVISAKRTAASAVLATQLLTQAKQKYSVGIIGCGLINFEVLSFLKATYIKCDTFYIYDIDTKRSKQFASKVNSKLKIKTIICKNINELFSKSKIISIATTTPTPYINDFSLLQKDTIILNISLRDIDPNLLIKCDNIVDDIDHVNRENTSVHLSFQKTGNTDFIRGDIGDLIQQKLPKKDKNKITIFFSIWVRNT